MEATRDTGKLSLGLSVFCRYVMAFAIEVKASHQIVERDLKGLIALREEGLVRRYVVVSMDPRPRHLLGIDILPWDTFLSKLWDRQYI